MQLIKVLEIPRSVHRKSFLIVKLGALGDLFFALPAARALKEAEPEAAVEVEWLVSSALVPALELFEDVDRVIPIDVKQLYHGTWYQKLLVILKARKQLRSRYDGILLFHRPRVFALFGIAKGPLFQIRRKPAVQSSHFFPFRFPLLQNLYRIFLGLREVAVPPLFLHESTSLRKVIDLALVTWGKPVTRHWKIGPQKAPLVSQEEAKNIVIHLGGGENQMNEFQLKRWPKMTELIRRLLLETESKLVLVGAPSEDSAAQAMLDEIGTANGRILNQVGKTDLPSLIQILSSAQVVVGPDSGPLHIADQLAVPCVGLYGPTSPISWGLQGSRISEALFQSQPCRPCYGDDGHFPTCPHDHICMTQLSVERVFEAILRVGRIQRQ